MFKITKKYVKNIIKTLERNSNTNKYNYGNVLIVAGSYGMSGAAIMCGKACIKSGAGLVTYLTDKDIIPILQTTVPEAMCIPFDNVIDSNNNIIATDFKTENNQPVTQKPFIKRFNVVVFGPGIGVNDRNNKLLSWLLSEFNGKMVIDADGINTIVKYNMADEVAKSRVKIILTPHEGEAKRLLSVIHNNDYALINSYSRYDVARDIATNYNVVSILKGSKTLICVNIDAIDSLVTKPDKEADGLMINLAENTTGNPGMATAGMGDVLSGMIGALLGQGLSTFDACAAGVWLHGKIGDDVARKIGQKSLTATDIIANIKL